MNPVEETTVVGVDESIAAKMVLRMAARVKKIVENSDYTRCPVGGQKDVNLFMIDGITAIIEQQSRSKGFTWISGTVGGGIGAFLAGAVFWTGKLHGWW